MRPTAIVTMNYKTNPILSAQNYRYFTLAIDVRVAALAVGAKFIPMI
jgi:hypothetical protein